jgi:DinB superfamily
MTAAERLARAAGDHRKAVGECAATIRAIPPEQWTVARADGKWTPAQIAEHLRIAYGPALSELAGGIGFAVRLPWWKRRLLRWTVLPGILRGRFPKGAPAPREVRPRDHAASPEDAARHLAEQSEAFLARLGEAAERGPVRLTHPYFGKLTAPQIVTLLTSHARHHRKQLPAGTALAEE